MPLRTLPAWLAGLSLVIFLASAGAQTPPSEETYDLSITKGLVEFGKGRYDKAEALFRKAWIVKPGDPDAGYYLGQTLIQLEKYEAAEKIFRQLLEAEPTSGQALLGLGITQYNQGKFNDALASLTAAEQPLPGDPLVQYYLGLVYQELEAFDQSSVRFRQAMRLSPDLTLSSYYYSGIAHYRRGSLEEAKAAFESVIASGEPESELVRSAMEYLALIRATAASAPRKWDLSFSVSSQYDDNVVLLPLGTQPPGQGTGISQKSDYRTVLFARGEYRPIQTETWIAGGGYGIYQSFHRRLSGFDVEDHTPSLFVQRQLGRLQARLQYVYDYVKVGRSPYLISHAIQPTFTLAEGESAYTQIQLRYQDKDFQHGRFTINSTRDGKNWLAGVTQYFLFADNTGHIRVGYTYDTDRTGGGSPALATPGIPTNADWAYRAHRLAAGLSLPPIYTLNLNLGFDYYRQDYDNPNSFSETGTTRRQDDIYFLTGTLSRNFGKHLSVAAEYSYTRDQVNISVFDYHRSVYSLTLTGRF